MEFNIQKYKQKFKQPLLQVWEQSVLATHHFLKHEDFIEIKQMLQHFNFNDLEVFCAFHNDKMAGFIGIHNKKVEMLFVDPDYGGKGLGKQLMQFAFTNFDADLVDVNAQNTQSVSFYEKLGFETFEKTEKDDLGKDYPLLRMRLN